MITGDLATMPLADLLQWADLARKSGDLVIEIGPSTTLVRFTEGTVVATSRPPAVTVLEPTLRAVLLDHDRACERMLDLFLAAEGSFHFYEEADRETTGLVDLEPRPVRALVMEGLRHLDEWPRLDKAYQDDGTRLSRSKVQPTEPLTSLQRTMLDCAARGASLAQTRLWLGLSRPALLRRMEELHVMGLIGVGGAGAGHDPLAKLLAQAHVLLRERQFEEVGIVLTALLRADATDARVRRLIQEAEYQEIAALYGDLDPLAVAFTVDGPPPTVPLPDADQEVLRRINDVWDVSALVLSSPLREVETLRSLHRLVRRGIVTLEKRSA